MKKLIIFGLACLFFISCASSGFRVVYEGNVTYVEHIKEFTRITFDSGAICILERDNDSKIEVGKRYWFVVKGNVVDYKEVTDVKK